MTGWLTCVYYDTRDENSFKYTYISISTNSGSTWCDMKVSTQRWQGTGTGAAHDYIGVEFNKGVIYPVWTDTRVGDNRYRTYTCRYEVIAKDLTEQNQTYTGTHLVQSANSITALNNSVSSGANVTYRTVSSITLLPGFYTNDNSYFSADLFHCDGYVEPVSFALSNRLESTETDNLTSYEFSLSQNYPNPFNPVTSIKYSLKTDSWVTIIIYNLLGQEVKILIDGFIPSGNSSVIWDGTNSYGKNVSSGLYFYKLTARQISGTSTAYFTDQKKMVIIR
jgi:hypothetical protein